MGSDLFGKGHCFIFLPYFFLWVFPCIQDFQRSGFKRILGSNYSLYFKIKGKSIIPMGSDQFAKGYCFMLFLLIFFSGFSLHSRLLEISDSLSLEEVKKIKFLVKNKVNGFRLARITEAFELFEELETNGVFPCHYIANLLAGIQRYDLVEKLGIQLPLTGNNENS